MSTPQAQLVAPPIISLPAGGTENSSSRTHIFVGVPLCLALVTFGLFFCLTILGLPVGLTLIAAGFKVL